MSGTVAAVGDNTIDCYVGRDSYSYVGGNAVNVAVQLTRLGRTAVYFGAVGPDDAGRQIMQTLASAGVGTEGIEVVPGVTSTSRIRVDPDGVRHFEAEDFGVCDGYLPGPAALDRIADCAAAHIGLMPGAEPVRRHLTARGVLVSQDCGVTLPVENYRSMDIAFCSEESAARPAEQIARDAVAGGAALAVVTRGAAGSLAFDGSAWWRAAAEPVDVVDTTGAGDAFAAGFIDARLDGADIDQALAAGARHAALACTSFGAWPQEPGPAPAGACGD
ncbi:MAG TPA: PfkB family carbohydrate kinase [Streptosporangiaceae bacterium]